MNKTGIIIAIAVIACFSVAGFFVYLNFTTHVNGEIPEIPKIAEETMLPIIYSNDKHIAIVIIPMSFAEDSETLKVANTIEYLSFNGYSYEGMYQTDVGYTEAHFYDMLIFLKP